MQGIKHAQPLKDLKLYSRKRKILHSIIVIATIGGYLAGDYAQDGVIDGSLLQTIAPYVQTLIL